MRRLPPTIYSTQNVANFLNSIGMRFNSLHPYKSTSMPNPKHINILMQGVKAWNRWRADNPGIRVDLRDALLCKMNLTRSDFQLADLTGANFEQADLTGAKFTFALLKGASLTGANLTNTIFVQVAFGNAGFSHAIMNGTSLKNCDLSLASGLETIKHKGPSHIDLETIYQSKGKIPEAFLRGADAPKSFITKTKSLLTAVPTLEFYSCFISHASKDAEFAKRLHADLQSQGVRCWFAPEDLKIGDKLRPSFDEAIHRHDKLLILLSEDSVKSAWVEKEVETAFEKERQQNRSVLFPIRLDDAVMETQEAWAADIRRTRHIGDFRDWKTHTSYRKSFDRLLRDLKSEDIARSEVSSR